MKREDKMKKNSDGAEKQNKRHRYGADSII